MPSPKKNLREPDFPLKETGAIPDDPAFNLVQALEGTDHYIKSQQYKNGLTYKVSPFYLTHVILY